MDTSQESDLIEQARGVIAARLEVEPEAAAQILDRVAQREGLTTDELACDVLASCTHCDVSLPRDLYTNGYGYEPAA
jgi:hypothetical protein